MHQERSKRQLPLLLAPFQSIKSNTKASNMSKSKSNSKSSANTSSHLGAIQLMGVSGGRPTGQAARRAPLMPMVIDDDDDHHHHNNSDYDDDDDDDEDAIDQDYSAQIGFDELVANRLIDRSLMTDDNNNIEDYEDDEGEEQNGDHYKQETYDTEDEFALRGVRLDSHGQNRHCADSDKALNHIQRHQLHQYHHQHHLHHNHYQPKLQRQNLHLHLNDEQRLHLNLRQLNDNAAPLQQKAGQVASLQPATKYLVYPNHHHQQPFNYTNNTRQQTTIVYQNATSHQYSSQRAQLQLANRSGQRHKMQPSNRLAPVANNLTGGQASSTTSLRHSTSASTKTNRVPQRSLHRKTTKLSSSNNRNDTNERLGCCAKLAKSILFMINLLFWSSGIALGAWGIFALVEDHKNNLSQLLVFESNSRMSLFQLLSWSFITLGCATVLVGICGCSALIKNNRWILGLYIFLILAIFALDLATGLLAIIFQERLVANVRLRLANKLRTDYGIQASFTAAIDYIQTRYECCGLEGHFDYDQSLWRLQRLGGFEATVARTCCHLRNTFDDQAHINPRPVNESMCQSTDVRFHQSYRYRRGCIDDFEKLIRYKIWTFTLACAGLGAIILVNLIFATCFCKSIPNGSSRKSSNSSSDNNNSRKQPTNQTYHSENRKSHARDQAQQRHYR